jgi:hypothetical protein
MRRSLGSMWDSNLLRNVSNCLFTSQRGLTSQKTSIYNYSFILHLLHCWHCRSMLLVLFQYER